MIFHSNLMARVEKVMVVKETSKGVIIEKLDGEVWSIELNGIVPTLAEGNSALIDYSIDIDSIGSKILFKGKDSFMSIWGAKKISDTPISMTSYCASSTPPTIGVYDLLKIGLNVLGYLNKNDIDKNDIVIAASKR